MTKMYEFALMKEVCEKKPASVPTMNEIMPEASAMPMEIKLSMQPTTMIMNDIIKPFLKQTPVGEATFQNLGKLHDMMKGVEQRMEGCKFIKFTFERKNIDASADSETEAQFIIPAIKF